MERRIKKGWGGGLGRTEVLREGRRKREREGGGGGPGRR